VIQALGRWRAAPAESGSGMRGRIACVIAAFGLVGGCVTNQGASPPVVDRSTDTRAETQSPPRPAPPAGSALPAAQSLHDGLPPDGHVVQSGDTLYGIAWRYGVDYRAVARLNGIDPPYRIRVGQRVMLVDPAGRAMTGPSVAGAPAPAVGVGGSGARGPAVAGSAVAAPPITGGAPTHAPPVAALPPEPSNRGFEFIPENTGVPAQTWPPPAGAPSPGAVPPSGGGVPAPAAAGAPAAGSPASPAGSSTTYGAAPPAPYPSGPTPAVPRGAIAAPAAAATAPASAAAPGAAPAASVPVLPAPTASAGTTGPVSSPTLASLPVEPDDEPGITAPLDEIPPETLGAPATQPATAATPVAPEPQPAPAPASAGIGGWRWPSGGAIEKGFGNGNKGIDFRLDPGKPVIAAGGGEVVYAGNGLGGFRNLVIVKHDQRFLSAYSLNWPIAVKEGQRLEPGSTIAAAGGSGSGTLRFEIRRDGQPVDPASIIKK
jgi:lipoprotein NlpD